MNLPSGARTDRASQTGLLLIMGSVLLWGAMPFAIEFVVASMPPAELTTVRMVAAGLLLVVPIGFRAFGRSLRQHLRLFVLLGLLGSAVPQLLYAHALQWIPVPTLTFITNSYPAFSILLAILILGERPQPQHIIGMISALAGLYLLTGPMMVAEGGPTLGIVIALVIALAWGSSSIASKKLITDLPANHVAAGRQLVAGLLAAPLMLPGGVQLRGVPVAAWLVLALLIVLTVFSFSLYYRGLAQTTVTNASLLEAFMPVVTLVLSVSFFGESLAPVQLLGAGLILVGTILVSVEGLRGRALRVTEGQEPG